MSVPGSTTQDAAAVAAYFATLRARHLDSEIRGLSGTCRFDIQSVGSWLLVVDDGHVNIRQSDEPADSAVRYTADDFLRVVHGEQDAFTAALQGKLRVSGNLAVVQLLGRIAP